MNSLPLGGRFVGRPENVVADVARLQVAIVGLRHFSQALGRFFLSVSVKFAPTAFARQFHFAPSKIIKLLVAATEYGTTLLFHQSDHQSEPPCISP